MNVCLGPCADFKVGLRKLAMALEILSQTSRYKRPQSNLRAYEQAGPNTGSR